MCVCVYVSHKMWYAKLHVYLKCVTNIFNRQAKRGTRKEVY